MSAFRIVHLDVADLDGRRVVPPALRDALRREGIVIVHGFPTGASAFVELLSRLGEPLEYYGDAAGVHPEHTAIWRVAIDEEAARRGEVHGVDGPLAVHSSQSLRVPRPSFFAMLMVDPGWQDLAPGNNGESLLVSWRDVAKRLRQVEPPDAGERTLDVLSDAVPFPDGVCRPLVYPVAYPVDDDDIGVRLKSDLADHLASHEPAGRANRAVQRFCEAARAEARRVRLAVGDLVIVDNDRWGHGRASVLGHRESPDGVRLVNPRELWSATVA